MQPIECVFDAGAGPNLIMADVLDPSWLNSIRHGALWDIRIVSNSKLEVSGNIIIHCRMGESCTRDDFGAVNELLVAVLLKKTYINRVIRTTHLTEEKLVPHHSSLVPILMVYKAPGEAESNRLDIGECTTEELAVLLTPNKIPSEDINTKGCKEADKNVKLAEERDKLHHDRYVQLVLYLWNEITST